MFLERLNHLAIGWKIILFVPAVLADIVVGIVYIVADFIADVTKMTTEFGAFVLIMVIIALLVNYAALPFFGHPPFFDVFR
jgi:hypothetical protein